MLLLNQLEGLRKHLHMRGADVTIPSQLRTRTETSPHAWSRPRRHSTRPGLNRNISTCVEQTACKPSRGDTKKKHLHMRGADNGTDNADLQKRRNISTCVEQTTITSFSTSLWRKHLHMRGADRLAEAEGGTSPETSPHAWSRQRHLVVQLFIWHRI